MMRLHRRKHGSQRPAQPKTATFLANYAGQGGNTELGFKIGEEYIWFVFESDDEVKELLSQAHIIHHNWRFRNV